jgi:pyrroloquinoline quinone (PQQ) biosynthesis protein C
MTRYLAKDSPLEANPAKEIMSFFERLKTAAAAEWRAYIEHPFTNALADGSLTEAAFRPYLVQDYPIPYRVCSRLRTLRLQIAQAR